MQTKYRVNQCVSVVEGRHEGAAGSVEEVRQIEGATEYKLHLSGVVNGVPVEFRAWFEESQLGAL